jgi:hypothetical protein
MGPCDAPYSARAYVRPVTSPTAKPGPDRAALSRDLADFLVELSIALHKHAMYPEGHPSLAPAVAAVARRAALLLADRGTVSLGVARDQLVIEGVATDPKHPVLHDLAGRLHRHHLGALTFRRGVEPGEVADLLRTLAVDAERGGQPLGLGPAERLRAWDHVRLHPVSFERLELVEPSGEEGGGARDGDAQVRAAQLWVGLARAALSAQASPDAPPPSTEPAVVAHAIDQQPRDTGYDQAVVGYLLQIAQELRTAGGAEAAALRRRMSRLIGALRPETLRRLVEMGGDATQRWQFALDVTYGMTGDAVVEVLRAAAEASDQTISHSLVRLLSKLAAHAEQGPVERRAHADAQLREQVRELISGWTLRDPNPEDYGGALERIARAAPLPARPGGAPQTAEPERLVAMAIELGAVRTRVWRAVDRLVGEARVAALLKVLDEAPPGSAVVELLWERVTVPDVVRRLLASEPPDFGTLDRLLSRLDAAALEPLLDSLAASESRATRRGLLHRLMGVGERVAEAIVRRLDDERWYVQRNMLVLLDGLERLPGGAVPARYMAHPDARVRREALKLRLKLPVERPEAITAGVGDPDTQVARLALTAAQQGCPPGAVPVIARQLADRALLPELRVLAIKALGRATTGDALQLLLAYTDGGRTLLGRPKLPPKSPEFVAALLALGVGWARDAGARAVLLRAARSGDPEIRSAAGSPP